jgi:hypothetical protein
MANCCTVDIDIIVNNKHDQNTLFEYLDKVFSEANHNNNGAYIGSEERYLFDAEAYDHTENSVKIIGWVKWGISNNEMVSFFKYLNEICFLQEVIVKEFEGGNGVCDKYVYHHESENVIKHYTLNKDFIFNAVAKEEENEEHSAMYECFEELENIEDSKEIEIK